MSSPNTKQPRSIPSSAPAVWDLVFADMQERDLMGEKKHGVRLQPGNGRDVLKDAYQEILDLTAYIRSAIYEQEKTWEILSRVYALLVDRQCLGEADIAEAAVLVKALLSRKPA